MPVLQGWKPADYCAGPAFDAPFVWPDLVGVGSVCRRPVHGATGLLSVVRALDDALPANVRLHLFGVKSSALGILIADFPDRIASVDSMAWNIGAWWAAKKAGQPWTSEVRAAHMGKWYSRQQATVAAANAHPHQFRLL